MSNRIIRIAAMLLGGALLLGGCVRQLDLDPAPEGESISFRAGSTLLRDDATTKNITESFITSDDSFMVFGERVTASDVHTTVFDGVEVTHHYVEDVEDYWSYSTARYWYWVSTSDRYDFVAISPSGYSINEYAAGNLSVSTHYDLAQDEYDILAATYRRRGTNWESRYNRVDLSFSHIGSAVGVTVQNNSTSKDITLVSIEYGKLVESADAKASIDNYGNSLFRWANLTPQQTSARSRTAINSVINPGGSLSGDYQIMIPQNLSLYNAWLQITYKVDDVLFEPDPIRLDSITRSNGTAITSWEIGYKYSYNVSVRVDGGLLVTVTTTPWDVPVEAETPGILI